MEPRGRERFWLSLGLWRRVIVANHSSPAGSIGTDKRAVGSVHGALFGVTGPGVLAFLFGLLVANREAT
jgi:hypothetical protein